MEGLGLIQVASLKRQILVLKDGHRSAHALEPDLPVERFLARHRVENDLLVAAGHAHEFRNDLLAETQALMTGQQRNVADVRTVCSISKRSANANELSVFVDKASEHAVRERRLETDRILVAKRSRVVERGEFIPVEAVDGV